MKFIESSIYTDSPSTRIIKGQNYFKFSFPTDYANFLAAYNGGIPSGLCVFDAKTPVENTCVLERFLPILADINIDTSSVYDVFVVMTQLDDRLIANPDSDNRTILVPIAALFGGNFVCLDFATTPASVSIWDHENSESFAPYAYPVATSFTDFLTMLRFEDK
jgi:hypothetical protein